MPNSSKVWIRFSLIVFYEFAIASAIGLTLEKGIYQKTLNMPDKFALFSAKLGSIFVYLFLTLILLAIWIRTSRMKRKINQIDTETEDKEQEKVVKNEEKVENALQKDDEMSFVRSQASNPTPVREDSQMN